MQDKIFLDTNFIIYLFSESESEHGKFLRARTFISELILRNTEILISTQVINEFCNVLFKKYDKDAKFIKECLDTLKSKINIVTIEIDDYEFALNVKEDSKISYYDSVIITTAIKNDCTILYSEDLNHNQIFENKLRVLNPFK